jgi:uncharacterized damage-inducible protein DinB
MSMRDSSAMRYEQLIRLVRVARGLDAGGYYNAAKLFWALAFSEDVRASNKVGVSTAIDDLDREMETAINTLVAEGVKAELITALQCARQGARENRTIPRAQIPPIFVCRTCGESALGQAPQRCPVCGARALTFREFLPTYFLEPLHPQQALAALASAPDEVEEVVKGLTEEQMEQPSKPGEWAIRNALRHLLVAQGLLAGRVEGILAEDNPSLEGVAAWAIGGEDSLSAKQILERYRTSRQATVERLRGIPVQDWWRTAQHDEFGQVTILQQASYFAKHERYHLPQIEAIRQAIGV